MKQQWINYGLGFFICAVMTYYAIDHMGPNAVMVVVLWGALLAQPIVMGVLWFLRYVRNAPLKPYQGHYYAFEHHPIRVLEFENALWIVDQDILPIIGLPVSHASRRCAEAKQYRYFAKHKNWAFAEHYILAIVQHSSHPYAPRLKLWLQRNVYFPYQLNLRKLHGGRTVC